jgi:drug/metabolite transporter (DMT)-like permease
MKTQNILQLLLLAAIWGSSYPIIKTLAPSIGIVSTLGGRVLIAAVFLLALSPFNGSFPDFKRSWKHYLILGALNLVVPGLLVIYSVTHLNASMGAVLNATTPMFTLIIAAVWLKQKITLQQIAGILLGMTGIMVLVGWNPVLTNNGSMMAIMASIAAAISYGIGSNYAKKRASKESPLQSTNGLMAGAALIMLPVLFQNYQPVQPTPALIAKLIFFGVVCTAFAFIVFLKLIRQLGSVKTSMVSVLVPVFGILWSAIFLKESINSTMVAGLALIISSVYLVISNSPVIRIPKINISLPGIHLTHSIQNTNK